MKISENELSRLLAVSSGNRRSTRQAIGESTDVVAPSAAGSSAAQVSISATAQDIQQVKQYISQLPDTRADRVAQLKAQVDNGTYHVSGEAIADLMIRRVLADNSYF